MYKINITKYEKLTPEELEKAKVREMERRSRDNYHDFGNRSVGPEVNEYRQFGVVEMMLTDEEFQAVKKSLVETL